MDEKQIEKHIEKCIAKSLATLPEALDEPIKKAVKMHVNGHIERLRADLQPVIDGVRFLNLLRRFLTWVSTFAISIAAIWGTIKLFK